MEEPMSNKRALKIWSTTFLAALGLSPAACDDTNTQRPGQDTLTSSDTQGQDSTGTDSSTPTDTANPPDTTAPTDTHPPDVSPWPCDPATPVVVDGVDTGYDNCGGFMRRREVVTCPDLTPRDPETVAAMCTDGGCTSDEECTEPNTYCGSFDEFGGFFCSCIPGCTTDAECATGEICVCGDPVGRCVSSTCESDDDCDGALLCTSYDTQPSCGPIAFACQTPQDTCGGGTGPGDCYDCSMVGDHRECVGPTCVIGRPFLIEGEERLAEPVSRTDWRAGEAPAPACDDMPGALRAELAEHWTTVGLMEHASIAAFARFALQLLEHGAPPELLSQTHAAMADETEHARLCFALASTYNDAPIGPGPLEMDGALAQHSMKDILEMLIREGCIGETVAALEAAESAEYASDPAVRAVLQKITADERRHALLAWRTVRWALERDPALGPWLVDAFEVAFAELPTRLPEPSPYAHVLLSCGVFDGRRRSELRREVCTEVIRPCLAALLAETPVMAV